MHTWINTSHAFNNLYDISRLLKYMLYQMHSRIGHVCQIGWNKYFTVPIHICLKLAVPNNYVLFIIAPNCLWNNWICVWCICMEHLSVQSNWVQYISVTECYILLFQFISVLKLDITY
jgi:hypothetical protein